MNLVDILSRMTQAIERDFAELAGQARARRLELGLSLTALTEQAGLARGTYQRIEQGLPLRDTNYAKIDAALDWASGSCIAILEGGAPVAAIDASTPVTPQLLIEEEVVGDAFMIVAVKKSNLPAAEIRAMKDDLIQELKRRGVL